MSHLLEGTHSVAVVVVVGVVVIVVVIGVVVISIVVESGM